MGQARNRTMALVFLLILLVVDTTSEDSLKNTPSKETLHSKINKCDEECLKNTRSNRSFVPRLNCSRFIWGRKERPQTAEEELEECKDCISSTMTYKSPKRVLDRPVPSHDCDNRANRTLPAGLVVKQSGIPGAGLGVWAERFIPDGIIFGPYGGEILRYTHIGVDMNGYEWVVCCLKNISTAWYLVDAYDERKANWLRYINCARRNSELNLNVHLNNGKVYFVSAKPIQPGTELLVFYGWGYAQKLGIDREDFFKEEHPEKSTLNMTFVPRLNCLRFVWGRKEYPQTAEEEIQDCKDCFSSTMTSKSPRRVLDSQVPSYDCENRANRTLPAGLVVKRSGIPEAGLGVWAERFVPEDIIFGPYGGEIQHFHSKIGRNGYEWVVCCMTNTTTAWYLVDAYDERKANWLRYVNGARRKSEQNLIVSMYKGNVYYVSTKPIEPGTELLVFFGWGYAMEPGIEREDSYKGVS